MENFIDTNQFIKGYIDAALWSTIDSYDDEGNDTYNLDDEFSSVSPKCYNAMLNDCLKFIKENKDNLLEFKELAECDDYRLGFLFWLNREGHGVGYWNELANGEDIGETLSTACRSWGKFPLYGDFENGYVCSHHYG